MNTLKTQIIQAIDHNSTAKVSELAGEFVHAASQEKEAILAGIDFERWLGETSRQCLENL